MKEDELFGKCPYATAQKVLSGKWTILVLHHLEGGPLRFNELQRRLPEMTAATLSKLLKRMEEDSLVVRVDYGEMPPRVEYELTPIGSEFRMVTDALGGWGEKYIRFLSGRDGRGPSAGSRRRPPSLRSP